MNKNRFFLVIIISMFLLTSLSLKSQSPCPTGWSQQTYTLTINGCDYSVTICYKCSTGGGQIKLWTWQQVDPNCIQTWDETEVLNNTGGIWDQITDPMFLTYDIPCGTCGPCDLGQGFTWDEEFQICWEKMWIDGRVWWVHCDLSDCFCLESYSLCWDNGTYVKTLVFGPEIECGLGHEYESVCPNSYIPPDPTENNPISPCFSIPTPCNP